MHYFSCTSLYLKFYRNPQTLGIQCQRKLELNRFSEKLRSNDKKEMYFLETSGRSWLTPREACSLESASIKSNLQVNIIFTSSFLDLHDNSTCYLYQNVTNIQFYTIKLKDAFEETPLERIYQRAEFLESNDRPTHLSDMLRVAIVYKYGGFYSDLDSITIKA